MRVPGHERSPQTLQQNLHSGESHCLVTSWQGRLVCSFVRGSFAEDHPRLNPLLPEGRKEIIAGVKYLLCGQ